MNGLIKFYSTPLGKKHAASETKLEKRLDEILEENMMPKIITWFNETLNIELPKNDINKNAIMYDDDEDDD